MPLAVTIIEDDARLRRTLADLIDRTPGLVCVGQHGEPAGALEELPWDRTEVVLLDLHLPAPGGLECLRRLKQRRPELPVLVFSVHSSRDNVIAAVEAGADGYAVKGQGLAQIEAGLRAVARGDAFYPPSVSKTLAVRVREAAPASVSPTLAATHLTPREIELLQFARKGLDYHQMAEKEGCAYNTIRKHWDNIREKLGVQSKAEAVARYFGL